MMEGGGGGGGGGAPTASSNYSNCSRDIDGDGEGEDDDDTTGGGNDESTDDAKRQDYKEAPDPSDPMSGEIMTVWYRPPELFLTLDYQSYNSSIDIWGAGCVMGEIMKRRSLFQGEREEDVLIKILKFRTPVEGLRTIIPELRRKHIKTEEEEEWGDDVFSTQTFSVEKQIQQLLQEALNGDEEEEKSTLSSSSNSSTINSLEGGEMMPKRTTRSGSAHTARGDVEEADDGAGCSTKNREALRRLISSINEVEGDDDVGKREDGESDKHNPSTSADATVSESALNLIDDLLQFRPSNRPTAKVALARSYFDAFRSRSREKQWEGPPLFSSRVFDFERQNRRKGAIKGFTSDRALRERIMAEITQYYKRITKDDVVKWQQKTELSKALEGISF
mmetsp:Transcript_39457/g.63233  ORF Transcript_39457/g.63233 Transcript_39457/m.63233 type:complete len:392 (+) Transcript_39457:809-1984(+)